MKHFRIFTLICTFCTAGHFAYGQGMAINSTGATPHTSAMLDVSATDKGVLVTRMTQTQRDAIVAPATGLLIYQTDGTPGFYFYNGSAWTAVSGGGSSAGWGLTGNTGTSATTNFIGNTDNIALRFRVNNTRWGNLAPGGNIYWGENSGHPSNSGSKNIAIGDSTLNSFTGSGSIAIGSKALIKSTGADNVAVGFNVLKNNTSGSGNCAFGSLALSEITTGGGNSAFGNSALPANITGYNNVAIGENALYFSTSGSYNSALGAFTLFHCSSGSYNTAVGQGAGLMVMTGSYNTAIGNSSNVSSSLDNAGAFGYNAVSNASNKIVIGNTAVTVIGGSVAWSNLSDARFKSHIQENVPGLDFVMKLRPVTYHFEARKYEQFLGIPDSLNKTRGQEYWKESENMVRTGFIAQEVEQAARQAGYDFSGLHKPATDKDNYTLAYSEFTVPLVKAMQEQQKIIEQQQKMLEQVLKRLAELEQRK